MRPQILIAALATCSVTSPTLAADTTATPYAGQQARTIKALSDDDVAALRKGEGMGMAKAAEFNGYPGPAHVLALARQLSLTDEQSRRVQLVFDRMTAAARPLGDEMIAHERTLDQLFAAGRADRDSVAAEAASIGELQGRLRSVHLAAHVEMRTLLTSDQIASYLRLRGNGEGAEPPRQHHHGQDNGSVNFEDLTANIRVMAPLGDQMRRSIIVEPAEDHPRRDGTICVNSFRP